MATASTLSRNRFDAFSDDLPPHLVLRINQLLDAQAAEARNELYALRREISEVDLDALKRENKLLEFVIGVVVFWVTAGVLGFFYLASR